VLTRGISDLRQGVASRFFIANLFNFPSEMLAEQCNTEVATLWRNGASLPACLGRHRCSRRRRWASANASSRWRVQRAPRGNQSVHSRQHHAATRNKATISGHAAGCITAKMASAAAGRRRQISPVAHVTHQRAASTKRPYRIERAAACARGVRIAAAMAMKKTPHGIEVGESVYLCLPALEKAARRRNDWKKPACAYHRDGRRGMATSARAAHLYAVRMGVSGGGTASRCCLPCCGMAPGIKMAQESEGDGKTWGRNQIWAKKGAVLARTQWRLRARHGASLEG